MEFYGKLGRLGVSRGDLMFLGKNDSVVSCDKRDFRRNLIVFSIFFGGVNFEDF